MIALNELLKNLTTYQSAYELMGLKSNLNVFVALESKLRETQLECEHKRSECNKKCGELFKLKNENKDVSELLHEIEILDNDVLIMQSKLEKISKQIEKKLKKLHNLPDKSNSKHLQIETLKKESDLNSLKLFLEKICKINSTIVSSKRFVKQQSEKVFDETDLKTATYTKNGVVLLCSQKDIDDIFDKLLNYFKQNSLSLIERSVSKLKKSSSRELFIHLKHRVYVKVEMKREFFTREHKIKYRDKSTDMTKFVNQINLYF